MYQIFGPVAGLSISKAKGSGEQDLVFNISLGCTSAEKVTMLEFQAFEDDVKPAEVVQAIKDSSSQTDDLINCQRELFQNRLEKFPDEKERHEKLAQLVSTNNIIKPKTTEYAKLIAKPLAEKMLSKANVTKFERKVAQTEFWALATEQMDEMCDKDAENTDSAESEKRKIAIEKALKAEIANKVFKDNKRPDGRTVDEIRQIEASVNLLPRAHGSALFSRGDTQVLCTAAVGPPNQSQTLFPTLDAPFEKQAVLHYNFPPYSVDRTGNVYGMNRRMVGHGALAEKAIAPILGKSIANCDFPFAVNVSSEVTGSDGSSSMASVCGMSLALMDAGVPLEKSVAGLSIGLYQDPENKDSFLYPADILGMEDHFGGMDFKIAGTRTGLTAAQLDTKMEYVSLQVISDSLIKAEKNAGFNP